MVKRRSNELGVAGNMIERRSEELGLERSKLLDEIEHLVMSGDLPRVSLKVSINRLNLIVIMKI